MFLKTTITQYKEILLNNQITVWYRLQLVCFLLV